MLTRAYSALAHPPLEVWKALFGLVAEVSGALIATEKLQDRSGKPGEVDSSEKPQNLRPGKRSRASEAITKLDSSGTTPLAVPPASGIKRTLRIRAAAGPVATERHWFCASRLYNVRSGRLRFRLLLKNLFLAVPPEGVRGESVIAIPPVGVRGVAT